MSRDCYDKEIIEGGIVVYRMKSTSRECVDQWFHDVASVFEQAVEQDASIRLMYDTRGLRLLTPHLVRRAQELADLNLPEDWRVATLTATDFAADTVNLIRSISLLSAEMYERSHIFSDEDEALAWLRES